jgi:DNA-binding NarL/FixJ family response regulator
MAGERSAVLILGETALMAAGLRHVLETSAEYTVVGSYDLDGDVLQPIRRHAPAILIVGLRAPVAATCRLLQVVKQERPSVRIIAISEVLAPSETAAVLLAGVDGLLDAAISPDALVAVLRLLRDQVRFVTSDSLWPSVLEVLEVREASGPPQDHEAALTRREGDVFELLRDGLTDREIAEVLTLSLWTVKHHVVNILQKLDMTSRREARRTRPGGRSPHSPPSAG